MPICKNATERNAFSVKKEENAQSSPQSSLAEEKADPSSTSSAEHVAPLTPVSTWLSSTPLLGVYYQAIILLVVFAFWSSVSYSVSIRTASSSNQINNANDIPLSEFRCNPFFCYSASLSFRKSEGFLPSFSSLRTIWMSPFLRTCIKDGKTHSWNEMPNGRRFEVMCSDAFVQGSTDINRDGGSAAGGCLRECILENRACEGILYLVDRPFEKHCFFQHNDERPAFEMGERIVGARLIKS